MSEYDPNVQGKSGSDSGAGSGGPEQAGVIANFIGKPPPGAFSGLSVGGSLLGGMTGGKDMKVGVPLPTPATSLGKDIQTGMQTSL